MKNILIVASLVVVFNGIFVFYGGLDSLVKTQHITTPKSTITTGMIDVFRFTFEDEVKKKIGTPSDGYEPIMFLEVFQGLVSTDFRGVEANSGMYSITDGVLIFTKDSKKLEHSAAGAISRIGYQTLLKNIEKRLDIDFVTNGTITDIMRALTTQG